MKNFFEQFSAYLLGESEQIATQVNATYKGDANTRMDIYRQGYAYQLIDILAQDFPSIYQILGHADFIKASTDYLVRYPSTSYTVRHFGQNFSKFLSETPPYAQHAYLWQLADFEWTKRSLFDVADSEILTFEGVSHIPLDAWESVTFEFIPALNHLIFTYNIPQVWQAIAEEKNIPEPVSVETPMPWVMWRKDFQPHWYSMTDDEDAFFIRARQGDDFASLCELLLRWHSEEDAAIRAAAFVRGWIEDKMLKEVNTKY